MIELSVIIPTYNRAGRLQDCLEALAKQTQPFSDFEVVVVVDGATDGTMEMLTTLTTPYVLTTIYQENQGQSHLAHGQEVAEPVTPAALGPAPSTLFQVIHEASPSVLQHGQKTQCQA